MRCSVLQFTPVFRDVDANTTAIVQLIASTKSDVIILPELATSGYFFTSRDEAAVYAEPVDGDHMQAITRAAQENGRVVVCGFAERDADALYNSAIIAAPDMPTRTYRKTHLFYKERFCFNEGNTGFVVVNIPHLDLHLGTMICYDWRFPEAARTLALQGADLIAVPSNLVTELWPRVMPTRAIENKVYVAVANREGSEENGGEVVSFNGRSMIYGYNGDELGRDAEIDPVQTRTKSFNAINDIFTDRRPEFYA
ncbi:carbon-nitrogen hydrolase [soil metagenome]